MAKLSRAEFAAKIKEKYPQYAEVDDNQLVDKIIEKYPTYASQIDEGKVDAPQDGASELESTSSESPKTETRQPGMLGVLEEPASHFFGTLGNIMAGATQMFEAMVYKRAQGLVADGKIDAEKAQEKGIFTNEALNQMTPEERIDVFEEWSLLGNDMAERAAKLSNLHADKQYGSGSISTELADGNYANAANLTVNQTAAGLASLVPFMVPGGVVLGPTLLGASAGGGAFQENLERENATMEQIYNASFAQAGNEFAWELVTAGIVGRAKHMLAGGASREAVKKFTQQAWKRVAGESTKEGFSEGITDTGSKYIDHLIFGDEHTTKQYVTGFADSAIVGAIVGGKVATFGELGGAGEIQQKVAAQTLRTEEQKNDSAERARKAAEAQKIIDSYEGKELDGSLIDQSILEAAEEQKAEAVKEEKAAEEKHIETLNDMTAAELKEYAVNLDKANKLEQDLKEKAKQDEKRAKVEPEFVPEDTAVIEDAIHEARRKAMVAYNTVANWQETTRDIDNVIKNNKDKIKEIEQEESNIKLEEQQAAKAEQPNPVGTRKRKQRAKKLAEQKQEVQENIKQLEKVKDEARPTHKDAVSRKRKAKQPEPKTKLEGRKATNEDAFQTLKDPNIPQAQKDKALSQFYKDNAGLITNIAKAVSGKTGAKINNDLRDRIKTEIFDQIQKKDVFDNKVWNNAQKAVERSYRKEQETVRRSRRVKSEMQEELDDITQQVADGVLDPEAAEILKDDIRAEYDAEGIVTTGLTIESEGDAIVAPDVEKATQETKEEGEAELIAKAMAGKTVDQLVDNLMENKDTIYSLLPKSAKTGKAFSGIFKDGNPDELIWESYFEATDRQGKDRVRQLKKALNQRINDAKLESDELTGSEMFDQALDFLEEKFKATSVTLKEAAPILGKLKRAFPGTKIIISRAKMAERLLESNQTDAAASALDGKIKGFVDGDTVYLNEKALDWETPIHEFGHLWAKATKAQRPDLYNKGIELLKETSIYQEVFDKAKNPKSVYHGLTKKQLEEEVIAHAIGRYGDQALAKLRNDQNLNTWFKSVFDWIGQQLGIKVPFENITVKNFLDIAVTEILTGETVVNPVDSVMLNKELQKSLTTEFLEVPVGSTRDYSPSTKPSAEIDTHGVFKAPAVKRELYTVINKYWDELANGGWIGYTTGSYGSQVRGTRKFNPKLNARIEAKVKVAKELVEGEGLTFKRDPKNQGFHIIAFLEKPKGGSKGQLILQQQAAKVGSGAHKNKKKQKFRKRKHKGRFDFLEASPEYTQTHAYLDKSILNNMKAALKPYKTPSPFKYSRIDTETADVLRATIKHFDKIGHEMTIPAKQALLAKVNEVVKIGKANRKEQKKVFKERQDNIRESANAIIKNSSKVDPSKLSKTEANRLAKKKDSFINKIFNRNLIANTLSPSTNNDFYGLMYDLLPSGKMRETARLIIDNLLLKPLEKANVDYLNAKGALRNSFIAAKETGAGSVAAMDKILNAKSEVEFGGAPLRNYDLVKVYNYVKDPTTYKPLFNTLDNDTVNSIIDAVNANDQLKRFADALPGVYAGVAGQINAKLDSHGRQTFTKKKIDYANLTPEQQEMLDKIYPDGTAPTYGVYTPLTSEGADLDLDVDKLIKQDTYTMYTVMDGRLKERTGAGEITLHGNNLDADFDIYLSGPVRTMAFLDFSKNASDFFGPKQMNAMRAANGDQWAGAVKDSLRRIVTGKNERQKQTWATKTLDKWVNRTVGTVMFFNVRSALLQQLSMANFMVDNPGAVFEGLRATRAEKKLVKDYLLNSEWVKERGAGKTDLAIDAIFGNERPAMIDQVLQKGYALTKLGDKFAITTGGAPYMMGRYKQELADGKSQEEALENAYRDFIKVSEETQQSTRAERLGQSQTTGLGKLLLAYANTPMQYNRKMARALKDLTASGTSSQRKKKAARELVYYGALQNAMFTTLQSLVVPGIDGGDEDDSVKWANSFLNTLLRGIGVWGAVVAGVKDALIAASQGKDALSPLVNVAPAVGTKVRHFRTAVGDRPVYAQSLLIDEAAPYRIASGINAATNIPADRVLKLAEQASDAVASDLTWYQNALRALGWSRYDLGAPAGYSPLNRLNEGETGQAFRDGTIEVDPDLSPMERQKTIQHEKKHQRDMANGKLDYDDNYVYYNDSKYARKDGKIEYNGKWYQEGDKGLPWEAEAYAAETPLKQTDPTQKAPETEAAHAKVKSEAEKSLAKLQKKLAPYEKNKDKLKGYPLQEYERWKKQEKEYQQYIAGDYQLQGVEGGLAGRHAPSRIGGRDYAPVLNKENIPLPDFSQDPDWVEQVRTDVLNWETHPETIRKAIEAGHASSEEEHLKNLYDQTSAGFKEYEAASKYGGVYVPRGGHDDYPDWAHNVGINVNSKELPGFGRESVLYHEFQHAGQDLKRGEQLKGILGNVKFSQFEDPDGDYAEYVNRPHEQYAFFQQLRHSLGLQPGQELTKEMIEEARASGSENPILNADIDKLIQANREVAQQELKDPKVRQKTLKDLYVRNANTGYA